MALRFSAVSFDDATLGMHSSQTDDGQVLSMLFDDLRVESALADTDAAPQLRRAEGVVQCAGSGWVSVQVRGAAIVAGAHGYAHALGWANGRRLRMAPHAAGEPFATAVSAPVGADGQLRLSLLLLAQRDLAGAASGAACWVDSIDIAVIAEHPRRAGGPA